MSLMVSSCDVIFPTRCFLDEIWDLIESVSEGFLLIITLKANSLISAMIKYCSFNLESLEKSLISVEWGDGYICVTLTDKNLKLYDKKMIQCRYVSQNKNLIISLNKLDMLYRSS